MLNAKLTMADGSETTIGMYLFDVLPDLISKNLEFAKEHMLFCLEVLATSMERYDNADKEEAKRIRKLQWQDGSIERYLGPLDKIYDVIGKWPEKYSDIGMECEYPEYMGIGTTIRQGYDDVVLSEQYKDAISQLLINVEAISKGQPIYNNGESILFNERFAHYSFLEVMLRESMKFPLDDELDPKTKQLCSNLEMADHLRPADSKKFDQQIKELAAYVKKLLTQPEQGQRLGA